MSRRPPPPLVCVGLVGLVLLALALAPHPAASRRWATGGGGTVAALGEGPALPSAPNVPPTVPPNVTPAPPVPPAGSTPAPGQASILPWAFHITSEFGHYPNGAPHYGLDLDATFGVVQTAPVGGVVEEVLRGCGQGDATCGRGWGNHVWWQSAATGHHILLAHFETLADGVQVGATVTAGQALGVTGATGLATGPHVHVQVNTDQCCTNQGATNPAWEFPWLRCDPEPVLGARFGGPCP